MDDALEWTPVDSAEAYRGFLRIESRQYRLPDGRDTRWDVLLGGRTVAVVAHTEDGRAVLARQFRPGPGAVIDELPGGTFSSDSCSCGGIAGGSLTKSEACAGGFE